MLIAGDPAAETATTSSNEDDDTLPLIEDILYRALQQRERCSMANAGPGEGAEAISGKGAKTICNRTPTPDNNMDNNMGNTQGELYTMPQNITAQVRLYLLILRR